MKKVFLLFLVLPVFVFAQGSGFSPAENWKPYEQGNVESEVSVKISDEQIRLATNLNPTRFLQGDPLADKFPGWSPYHYSGNNPIVFIDPTGKEWYYYQGEGQDQAQWNYHKDTKEMSVWTGQYDKNDKKIMETQKGIVELLGFNGSELTYYQAEGGTQSWAAVSGQLDENGNTQSSLQSQQGGPIPEGWYTADPNQIQRWSDLSTANQVGSTFSKVAEFFTGSKVGAWPGGTIAWGDTRLPLSPTQVGNRSNFFIHGGAVPGSAGCIDLTNQNNAFFYQLSLSPTPLPLSVRYRRGY